MVHLLLIGKRYAYVRNDPGIAGTMLERLGVQGLAELLQSAGEDDAAFAAASGAESTGRPLGNADFIAGLERLLGRPIARRVPGRKPAGPALDQPSLL